MHTKLDPNLRSEVIDVSEVHATAGDNEPILPAEARLHRLQPRVIETALNNRHKTKVDKYRPSYVAHGHTFVPFVVSTRGPIHPEAQRMLYFIAQATTRQHMHYYTTDLQYETVMARNIKKSPPNQTKPNQTNSACQCRGFSSNRSEHSSKGTGFG